MHNADWDGIKAVPIALGLSGLILITINLPLLGLTIGGIMLGAFAIVWLYNWFKEQRVRHQWEISKRKRHENTLPANKAERASSNLCPNPILNTSPTKYEYYDSNSDGWEWKE